MASDSLSSQSQELLRPPLPGAGRVFALFLTFSLIFSLCIPWLICRHYGISRQPQDFFPMPNAGGDYVGTYVAGQSLFKGRNIYHNYPDTIDPFAAGAVSRYTYAPVQAYLMAPLSLLPYETSYKVWTWLTVALIGLSAFLASRLFETPYRVFIAGFLIIGQSTFLLFERERGQTNSLVLVCIAACAYFYLKRRNPYWAGFFCALGTALKITPGIFVIFFLLRKDWRAVLATAVSFAGLVLLTSPGGWYTWITESVPAYAGLYIGYAIDHSLLYLIEGFVGDVDLARRLSQIAACILMVAYMAAVSLNRERDRFVTIELALLTIIMEVSTPWSVNYKLIVLVFMFVSPFAILRIPFVARRPVLYATPIIASFIPIGPQFNEYLVRVPYSLIGPHIFGHIVPANPLDPFFTDRRVAVAVMFVFGYLFTLYLVTAVRSRPALLEWLRAVMPSFFIRLGPARTVVAFGLVFVFLVLGFAVRSARAEKPRTRECIKKFGEPRRMNDYVSAAGYRIIADPRGHHTVTVIYQSKAPMPHNLQIYLHAHKHDEKGAIVLTHGRNFSPSMITSFWPRDRYVVATTTLTCSLERYELRAGFFDLSNGLQYGEASLGTVDFASTMTKPQTP